MSSGHEMLEKLFAQLFPDSPHPLNTELVPLEEAVGRVVATDMCASFDAPLFDESMRDGYAISSFSESDSIARFTVVGESAAGDRLQVKLQQGEAWRVMTGGMVPGNCSKVVPLEWCHSDGNELSVDSHRLEGPAFIKRKGCDRIKDGVLVEKGKLLTPTHLELLASGGHAVAEVFTKPRVCFCCTGKELVAPGKIPDGAEKVSSNQYLLSSLLMKSGCEFENYGIVGDDGDLVAQFFDYCLQSNFDLILTTGGTGRGDYDLVEKCFLQAGGTVLCNSVNMRPGKTIIAGTKGKTYYVGLPGPPSAAHTVFLELVSPLLLKMSGVAGYLQTLIHAKAQEDLRFKTKGELLVKEGVVQHERGSLFVRTAQKGEIANCNMLISPTQQQIQKGELVDVHLRDLATL